MNSELTPELREEIQMVFLRRWLGRKRRAAFGSRPAAKHYDMSGRLVGHGTVRHAPTLTTFVQDRQRA